MNPITYVLTDNSATGTPAPELPQPLLGMKNPSGAGAYLMTVLAVSGAGGATLLATTTDATVIDGESPSTRRLIPVMCRLTSYHGANDEFGPVMHIFSEDTIDAESQNLLACGSFPFLYDGSAFSVRLRAASATNLSAFSGQGAQLSAAPGEWTANHIPAAGVLATVTRAGQAGVVQVCRSITASISAVNVQGAINVVLRDGASGAGAILWSCGFVVPAGNSDRVAITGLNIAGTAGEDMTLEFTGAPAAGNGEQVTFTGYDAI